MSLISSSIKPLKAYFPVPQAFRNEVVELLFIRIQFHDLAVAVKLLEYSFLLQFPVQPAGPFWNDRDRPGIPEGFINHTGGVCIIEDTQVLFPVVSRPKETFGTGYLVEQSGVQFRAENPVFLAVGRICLDDFIRQDLKRPSADKG
ncbi:hypothetical protein ACFL4V_00220 [Candidatus Latescibacterota bacterium]